MKNIYPGNELQEAATKALLSIYVRYCGEEEGYDVQMARFLLAEHREIARKFGAALEQQNSAL